MISLTLSGLFLSKILVIIVLTQTDLPLPVEPAINKWGVLSILVKIASPATSFPNATDNGELSLSLTNTSFIETSSFTLFGISIPISDLPGIGASILTSLAARFNAISLLKFTILLTLVPGVGNIWNCVIDGPTIAFTIFTSIPKLLNVLCNIFDFSTMSLFVIVCFFIGLFNNVIGGNL